MTKQELSKILQELHLTQREAAQFLSVDIRTVRRWVENPNKIPAAAEHALRAWLCLNRLGMAWRPGEIDIVDPKEIAEHLLQRSLLTNKYVNGIIMPYKNFRIIKNENRIKGQKVSLYI